MLQHTSEIKTQKHTYKPMSYFVCACQIISLLKISRPNSIKPAKEIVRSVIIIIECKRNSQIKIIIGENYI